MDELPPIGLKIEEARYDDPEYGEYLLNHQRLFPHFNQDICPGCGREIGTGHGDQCVESDGMMALAE